MGHAGTVERGVMVFSAAGRTLALPLEAVVEVLRMVALTPLPEAPPWVAGAINVRGRAVTVLDARPRLGAPATPPDVDDLIVLVAGSGEIVGIIAESVEGVARLSAEQPAAPAGSPLVAAIGRVDDRLIPLVDVDALLGVTRGEARARPGVEGLHAGA